LLRPGMSVEATIDTKATVLAERGNGGLIGSAYAGDLTATR
jgi:hypothetical protein